MSCPPSPTTSLTTGGQGRGYRQDPEPPTGTEGTKDSGPARWPSCCGPHYADVHISHVSSLEPHLLLQGALVLCSKAGGHTCGAGLPASVLGRFLIPGAHLCRVGDCRQDLVCHFRTFHPSIQPIKIKKITFKSSSGLQGVVRSPGRPRVGGSVQE